MIILKQNKNNSKVTVEQSDEKLNSKQLDFTKEKSSKKEASISLDEELFSSTGLPTEKQSSGISVGKTLNNENDNEESRSRSILDYIEEERRNPSKDNKETDEDSYYSWYNPGAGFPFTDEDNNEEFSLYNVPEDYRINFSLKQNSLTSMLSKYYRNTNNFNIEVLSHEPVYFEKTSNRVSSNQLFNSLNENTNQLFKKLKESEINKSESIFDRFVLYADVDLHSNISNNSYNRFLEISDILDQTSLFTNKLENEINYGNIINKLVSKKSGFFNGKVFKTIMSEKNSFIRIAGSDDERLLDKQNKNEDFQNTGGSLEIFYENICGFKSLNEDNEFKNSFQNTRIINSDRVIGQMMLNTAISMFSLYPNTDDVLDRSFFQEREDINSSGLNMFPIIQVGGLNLNSKIFDNGRNSLDLINIKGDNFTKEGMSLKESTIPMFVDNPRKRVYKNDDSDLDAGSPIKISERRSLIGGGKSDNQNDNNLFDNSTFRFSINSNFVFETIYANVNSYDSYKSPTFLLLPERYFGDNNFDYITSDVVDASENDNPTLFFDNENLPQILNIGNAIKSSLFTDFTSEMPITGSTNSSIVTEIKELFDADFALNISKSYLNCFTKSKLTDTGRKYNFDLEIQQAEAASTERILDGYYYLSNEMITGNEDNLSSVQNIIIDALDIDNLNDEGTRLANKFSMLMRADSNNIPLLIQNSTFRNDVFIYTSSNSILSKDELKEYLAYQGASTIVRQKNEIKSPKKIGTRDLNNKETVYDYVNNIFSKNRRFLRKFDSIFSIVNSSNVFKRLKIKDDVGIFKDFVQKARSKVLQEEKYSLLYSQFEEISLDTFENSSFIDSGEFYKNNFSKEFSIANNTTKSFISEDKTISNNHLFTSKRYREMLSKFYTKSFMRSKTSLFKKAIIDNIDIFKNSTYTKNSLGFDLLLATGLLNKSGSDDGSIKKLCKLILSNAIIQEASIENQASSLYTDQEVVSSLNNNPTNTRNYLFSKNFKKIYTKEFVEDITKFIYNQKSITDQDNYILRVTTPANLNKQEEFNITASGGNGGVSFNDIPGYLCNLTFPFNSKHYEMNKSYVISDNFANATNVGTRENRILERALNTYKSDLKRLSARVSYNHDTFINEEKTGIVFYENKEIRDDAGEVIENKFITKGFDFNDKRIEKGTDLNICYYVYNQNQGFAYKESSTLIPFSYFHLSKKQDTFSNKLTNFSKSLLQVFKADLSNINNIGDVFNFIDQNDFYLKIMQNIFEFYSSLFLTSMKTYQTILIDNIAQSSLEGGPEFSYDDFKEKVGEYNFNNTEAKEKAISDLRFFLSLNNNNEFYSYDNYSSQEFLENGNEIEVYSERVNSLREIYRLLKNSDLAEAFSHDFIHGYFLNFEDNVSRSNENLDKVNENISSLKKEIEKIQTVNGINFDLKDYIFDEFYQNVISKRMSELSFYKNIYNETFANNNLFLSKVEKYKNINAFSHRRLYYENKYKQATAGYDLLKSLIGRKRDSAVLDIIKFPIYINSSSKIGEKGIIQIDIQPVNLKYPEIKYEKLTRYYTSTLTDVTSNFSSFIGNDDVVNNFIGFYNPSKKISERYVVVDKETANLEMKSIVTDIFKRRQYTSEGLIVDGVMNQLSIDIVNDMIISNAIKNTSYINQQAFNDNINLRELELSNLVGSQTTSFVESLGEETLTKIFENFNGISSSNPADDETYSVLSSEKEILENNEFYKKFIINLDKDTSNVEAISAIVPKKYYDVFCIAINKETLNIESHEDLLRIRNNDFESNQVRDNSFSYYISAEVLQWTLIVSKILFTQ